ncbi:hypothetical protein G6F65_011665 [Rhizopus arrhizus]|nr:hypothetical protein G6F65_011665 [Rhizopus arrhizus]
MFRRDQARTHVLPWIAHRIVVDVEVGRPGVAAVRAAVAATQQPGAHVGHDLAPRQHLPVEVDGRGQLELHHLLVLGDLALDEPDFVPEVLARIGGRVSLCEVRRVQILHQRLPADDPGSDEIVVQLAHDADAAVAVADPKTRRWLLVAGLGEPGGLDRPGPVLLALPPDYAGLQVLVEPQLVRTNAGGVQLVHGHTAARLELLSVGGDHADSSSSRRSLASKPLAMKSSS